jgi:hypothetical protein
MATHLEILILILPFAFAVHNLEETVGMEKWTKSTPKYIHSPVTTRQFAIASGLFTILGFIIIFARDFYPTESSYLFVVTGLAGMLFLNVFFPHLIATVYLRQYAPGILSGLFIIIPLTTLIIVTVVNLNILTTTEVCLSSVIGGFIGIILTIIFLKIGDILTRSAN